MQIRVFYSMDLMIRVFFLVLGFQACFSHKDCQGLLDCTDLIAASGVYNTCINDTALAKLCCKTCQNIEKEKSLGPDCKYGDDAFIYYNNENTTCDAMMTRWGHDVVCEEREYLKNRCCATCQKHEGRCFDVTSKINAEGEMLSCTEAVSRFGAQAICVDHDKLPERCCKSCQDAKLNGGYGPECTYGDKPTVSVDISGSGLRDYTCIQLVHVLGKHDTCDTFPQSCCATCAVGDQSVNSTDYGPDCEHGDDIFVYFNRRRTNCNALFKELGYERICMDHDLLQSRCCGSCVDRKGECFDVNTISVENEDISCRETITTIGAYRTCVKEKKLPNLCCKSCQDVERERGTGPDCRYGDDEYVYFNKKKTTCDAMVKKWGYQTVCEESDYFKPRCCATCQDMKGKCFDATSTVTWNDEGLTCKQAVDKLGAHKICVEHDKLPERCCKSCEEARASQGYGQGCEYGDHRVITFNDQQTTCDAMLDKWGYHVACLKNRYLKAHCCGTCIDKKASCKDEDEISVHGEKMNCTETIRNLGAYRSCVSDDDIQNSCCETCEATRFHRGAGPGCEYGEDEAIRMHVGKGHYEWYTCAEITNVYGLVTTCTVYGERCCVTCADWDSSHLWRR